MTMTSKIDTIFAWLLLSSLVVMISGSITSVDILEVLSDNSMRALATPIPQNQSIKLYADITWTAGSQPVTHRWDVDTIAIATTGADTSVNGYIIFPEWTLPDGTTTFQVEVLDTGPSIIYTQTDSGGDLVIGH